MAKFCTKCGADLSKSDGICKCSNSVNFTKNGVINRKALKDVAKEKLNGNMWNIWKPLLIMSGIFLFFNLLIMFLVPKLSYFGPIISLLFSFTVCPLFVGYILYILKLIRGENFSLNDLFDFYDKRIFSIIGISLLVFLFTFLWSLLLVIPAIIAIYSYIMVSYVFADGTTNNALDTIKESKRLMQGYKWDYFVFLISFIGWIMIKSITFGIAGIYTIPYMTVSNAMYYDELKKIKEI